EDQSAHLGAEQVFVSLVFRQYPAEANLGQAGAVERRRVEVASALLPGGLDRCRRLLFGAVAEHVAQRRSPKAYPAVDQLVSDANDASKGVSGSPWAPPAQWLTEHPTVADGPSRSTEPWLPEVMNRLDLVSLPSRGRLHRRRRGDRVRAGPGTGQFP